MPAPSLDIQPENSLHNIISRGLECYRSGDMVAYDHFGQNFNATTRALCLQGNKVTQSLPVLEKEKPSSSLQSFSSSLTEKQGEMFVSELMELSIPSLSASIDSFLKVLAGSADNPKVKAQIESFFSRIMLKIFSKAVSKKTETVNKKALEKSVQESILKSTDIIWKDGLPAVMVVRPSLQKRN